MIVQSHVLIIDDEVAITKAIVIRLQAAGIQTEVANSGLAGIACAMARRPDLIVLDIRMPDIDGFEVNRRLRAIKCLSNVPVIFLSANVRDKARHAAIAGGAAGYLTKPFEHRQLLEAIRNSLSAANPRLLRATS